MLLRECDAKRMVDDALFIIERARFVMYVDDQYRPLHTDELLRGYYIDVLVVIGEVYSAGVNYSPCILLEIGLGRARPYGVAETPKSMRGEGVSRTHHKRQHFVSLDKVQIDALWPYIEYTLQNKIERQLAAWKVGTSWSISTVKRRVRHGSKRPSEKSGHLVVDKGAHITISDKDERLLDVIRYSEIVFYKKTISKFAEYIKLCLKKYKQNHYSEKRLQSFCRFPNSGMAVLVSTFVEQKVRRQRIAYMLQTNLLGDKEELFLCVLKTFKLIDVDSLSRFNFSDETISTFDPDTQVRVLDKRRENQKFTVVELVPKAGRI